jgi:putative DNA primase/helicase
MSDSVNEVMKWAARSANRSRVEAMIDQSTPYLSKPILDFDTDPMKLTVLNGTIDLHTGNLLPHLPGDFITLLAPLNYNPDAQAPLFESFMNRTFGGDDALVRYVQRALGYSLTGKCTEQCLFFCHGDGANGKSTLINVVQHVVAGYGQNAAPDLLIHKQERSASNDLARLFGRRFVSVMETGEGRRLDEERVKRLTGGDVITARFLHKEFFEFEPRFKLWMISNFKPLVNAADNAIFRRIKLIPFLVCIPEEERDPNLLDKLKEEAEGILAWMVRGCLIWQKQGLQEPDQVRSATASYRSEMDNLQDFLEVCCDLDPEALSKPADLLDAYNKYTGEHLTPQVFGTKLRHKGFERKRIYAGQRWKGIKLKDKQVNEDKRGEYS